MAVIAEFVRSIVFDDRFLGLHENAGDRVRKIGAEGLMTSA